MTAPEDDPRFPVRLQAMAVAYYQSQVLHVALERGLFARLAARPLTVEEAAAALGLAPRPARRLLEACAALALVEVDAAGRYANSAESARWLVPEGPRYVGHYLSMMVGQFYASWGRLGESLARDAPVHAFFHDAVERDPETARRFTAAVHDAALVRADALADDPALDLGRARRLLDVGGGSGATAIALAERHPALRVTVFDLPAVCGVAAGFVARSPARERVTLHPGDLARDPLPRGFDVVLIGNTLQVMGPAAARALVAQARGCLDDGGRVAVVDLLLDDDRRGPRLPALFSLTMLLITAEGAAHDAAEVRAWLADAGLTDVTDGPLVGPYRRVVGWAP